jgi:hypothetical protein
MWMPVVTVRAVRDKWQVNYRMSLAAITNLKALGILREVTGTTRNHTWMASEILDLVGGDAPAVFRLLAVGFDATRA